MLGLPLPWMLLAVVLAVGSAGAVGYSLGVDVESGRRDAAIAEAQNAALEVARLDAEAAAKRAAEAQERAVQDARRRAAAEARLRESRLRNEIEILKSRPLPDCGLPEPDVERLRQFIRAANGGPDAMPDPGGPGGLHRGVPTPPGTGERGVAGPDTVGTGPDRVGRPVPGTASDVR